MLGKLSMIGAIAATLMSVLAGCAGPGQLFLQNPIPIDHLDGNYQRLASCTYEQLARRPGRWRLIDLVEQHTVRIAHTNGSYVSQWLPERARTCISACVRCIARVGNESLCGCVGG
jgi:hypothetical protein